MSSSTSSSPPSSPSSPTTLEGYQLLTVQTMSTLTAHGPSKGPQDHSSNIGNGMIPASSLSQGLQGQRIAGRASVTLLRVSDINLTNRNSWEPLASPPPAYSASPEPSPLETHSTQSHTRGSYARNRSIARASRPPDLPLASSSHDGINGVSGSPPERLSMRAPTPTNRRRQRTFTVPPDAPEPPEAPAVAVEGVSARQVAPDVPEPTSAHSHRSFATFGGGREPDSPTSRDHPPPAVPPIAPRPTPSPRTRHQSLDTPQEPFPLPPRLSSKSHTGGFQPRTVLVPTRTSSLGTAGSLGTSSSPYAHYMPEVPPLPQIQAQDKEDIDVPVPSHWPNRRARANEVCEEPGTANHLEELIRVNSNPLGHQLEPADQDAMTETMSLDYDVRSESGISIAPLLPRPSTDSQSQYFRASSDCGHARSAVPRYLPRPARVTQSLDHSHEELNTSTLDQQQKALLIRRNRKLGQLLGESLPESDVGQFVVEPSVGGTTVLTKVVDGWPQARGPEWARDDCVPQISEGSSKPDAGLQRKRSKVKRSMDAMRSLAPAAELQVYVSRETSVTETVAPIQAHVVNGNGRKVFAVPSAPSAPGSPAPSSPPSTPFQTREEAVRARRRAQLAKLQRILGSPISPRLVLAPDLDEVPTCGMVRTPSETSVGSHRKAPFRERVKSFVIPSPIYTMSETERRLARKRASKLEHLFGDTPPQEMYLPVVKPLDTPNSTLGRIQEGGSAELGGPAAPVVHRRELTEDRMFISTSPAAAANPSPENAFEGYKHSLQGLMHLVENDQIRLATIIDQLEPQLYNLQAQSTLALQMPSRNASFVLHPAPPGLARRSSAPPVPTFSPRHPSNGGANGAGANNSTPSIHAYASTHGHGQSEHGHGHASVHGHGSASAHGHGTQPSFSSARRAYEGEARPSLQSHRSSGDPFSEYLRTQESAELHQQRLAQGYAGQQGLGEGRAQHDKLASSATATAAARPAATPRKLSGFFGKAKFPATTPSRLTFLANASSTALASVASVSAHGHGHGGGRSAAATATETDNSSNSGTLRKKERRERRGRKFSKLFSNKAARASAAALDQQSSDPFFIRRQTLDGVLAEMKRSVMLDVANGQLKSSDAQKLMDMLDALNRMRAESPWAEVRESEP